MKLIPMPSPRGTNHERLFINAPRGGAYDAKGGLRRTRLGYDASPETQDPVHTLFAWITAHLDDAAQSRLIELLAAKSEPFAQDNEAAPSFDPMQTKRVAPGQSASRAYDAKMASLEARYSGISRIGLAY